MVGLGRIATRSPRLTVIAAVLAALAFASTGRSEAVIMIQTTFTVDTGVPDVLSPNCANGHSAGSCTLRQAIANADNVASNFAAAVRFDLGGGQQVTVSAQLPSITRSISIDGQYGSVARVELRGPGNGMLVGLEVDKTGARQLYPEFGNQWLRSRDLPLSHQQPHSGR
jgi:hypothetical protein